MLKNSLFSPLCLAPFFCFSRFLFFFFLFSAAHLFFFSVSCFPRCCSAPALLFFSFCVLPFIFQPKIRLFQPKRFSAPKHFFLPKTFFSSAQNVFFFFSSSATLLFFFFLLYSFLVQPSFFSLLAPPFFLFFSSVYPRPNILFSCFTSLLFE